MFRGRIYNGGEDAQGMVEFALFIFIALLIFLGTIDFARFAYYDSAIQSAARVGAEVASNHCTPYCGSLTVTTDDWVVASAVCEPGLNFGLQPQPPLGCNGCQTMTGAPGSCNDPYNTSTTIYHATAPSLTQDVYLTPAYAPSTGTSLPSSPTPVTVYVGYDFTPINPIIQRFFPARSCFPGDSTGANHHTLCATAVGKIST